MKDFSVSDVRSYMSDALSFEEFVIDKTGVKMVEFIGASFFADKPTIFGEVNHDYAEREIQWYLSQSLNVNDIPGKVPEIWKKVATPSGEINSNYGWCVFSDGNFTQAEKVVTELKKHPFSRRAVMIYTRPRMWFDYDRDGMSDFMCTNAVQYLVRNGKVWAVVQMRSNDSVFGYKNDRHWQDFMLKWVAEHLNLPAGGIHWQVGSLHVYERHFYLVDHFSKTGETTISKAEYNLLYPHSPWADR